jgi:hypothetical protein
MTKEETGQIIEGVALQHLIDEAMNRTREDICQECLDYRCKSGKICKEFLRRSQSYAWEIAARNAELN